MAAYVILRQQYCAKRGRAVKLTAAVLLVLLVFAGSMWAAAPVNSFAADDTGRDDVALSAILMFRGGGDWSANPTNWNLGAGGDVSFGHFFNRHFGLMGEADYIQSTFLKYRGYGYRAGPILQLRRGRLIQPYLLGLGGYSRYKEVGLGPGNPYVSGASYIVGGGIDWRLSSLLSLRTGLDFEGNSSLATTKTRMFRFTAGLKITLPSEGGHGSIH